ncbi:MAG: hypothetical protein UR66_C0008G0019 [Candidatus Moranbacteria bacterium GW2011_GWE1_35_17]|nr:MAG: hypothetical protein UR66_C0008G0019 [Candidatus Moranbacteria bacterium GW2011_GWE1_35_17]KKP71597.1 MAG: hypothetical protein UR65_C0030G0006 [Candidatus Moranbacteria bacterium GW2011_GWE2_35_164]KKP80785.1 MAG: hypothetical protein UR82_C0082G0006 [Candidatus Moranbacteria bacterium GW2011_GWF1_35_5]KKP84296.1 MAG: hypothetical protein UR83_C0024G0025 [Candidatus Moranbacteria bacterium GW2011_GWF2_35_54]
MNRFIVNNKELLITFFCIWVGTVFTVGTFVLFKSNENIKNTNYEIRELKSELNSILFVLAGVKDSLAGIDDIMTSDFRRERVKEIMQ